MKIALIGYGKMGKAIEEIAIQRGHEVILRVDSKTENWEKELTNVDVAIEFTRPDSAIQNISSLIESNIPTITGTTGWYGKYSEIYDLVKQKNGSFLAATNFSIGVNLFFAINKHVARLLNTQSDYEVSMEEIHHLQKLDAPSGTAITLAEQIIENLDSKNKWICIEDENQTESIDSETVPIYAFREDGVPGTHTINYESEIDSITLTHTAHSRKGFALGAVLAAEFILNKKGIFTMNDVLNIQGIS